MSKYWKSILAAVGTLATWGITASADGNYSQEEWWGLLAVLAGTAAVYVKGNTSNVPVPDESVIEPGH